MSRIEYDLLRENEPWMKMAEFEVLFPYEKARIKNFDRSKAMADCLADKMRGELTSISALKHLR
jgi:hypothetical protein